MELSIANAKTVAEFSRDQGWLQGGFISAEIAGEGNMNHTLRVVTDVDSIVLKQSVPYVAKYPDIPAPINRDRVEAAFYQALVGTPLATVMPTFLGHVPEYHLTAFEDLGPASDCTDAYSGAAISPDIPQLMSWLRDLHQLHITTEVFTNRDMRTLNHAYIFKIPFEDHGSVDIAQRAKDLGNLYLSDGDTLLHGDYYPGSWLRTTDGIRIIDPEFAFTGMAEFDLGVFAAHLAFAPLAITIRPTRSIYASRWASRALKFYADFGVSPNYPYRKTGGTKIWYGSTGQLRTFWTYEPHYRH